MRERKLELLEVMRGLAAIWVLLHHADQSVAHFVGALGGFPLVSNGYLGVDFFFVLSGFIISFSACRLSESGQGLKEYFSARLVRIYVPYLPIGLGIFILYCFLPGLSQGGRVPSMVTTLTLLPTNSPPALSVAWTLVHEIIFYVIFSLWFVSRRALWSVVAFWVVTIFVIQFSHIELGRFTLYFLSPLNLYFVLGVSIFMLWRHLAVGAVVAIVAAIAGFALVMSEAMQASPQRIFVALGFALMVVAAASSLAAKVRVWNWLLSLGSASYAVYLVHNPVLSIVIRVVKRLVPDVTPWMAMFMISSIALGAGVVFWRLYERPALRYTRSWVRERFGIGSEYPKKIAV